MGIWIDWTKESDEGSQPWFRQKNENCTVSTVVTDQHTASDLVTSLSFILNGYLSFKRAGQYHQHFRIQWFWDIKKNGTER